MASHVVVISTDLRRVTVKVSPGTFLTDVLQEACRRFGLPSDRYLLKHNKKNADLGAPFRTLGLSPGAKLELVVRSNTPSVVSVALQVSLPEVPGGRLTQQFPSNWTVWQILRQFESSDVSRASNLNLTARAVVRMDLPGHSEGGGSGQLFYETPSLNILGRELSTFVDFQRTLSQLGYNSGSVLLRLTFKETDRPLLQVMDEISRFFKDDEIQLSSVPMPKDVLTADPPESSKDSELDSRIPSDDTAAIENDPIESTSGELDPATGQRVVATPPPNDLLQPEGVWLPVSSSVPSAARIEETDDEFTPSLAQVHLHQTRLQMRTQNQRLLSDQEEQDRAASLNSKFSAVTAVTVRVRFPDNTMAQWKFGPQQAGSTLYEAVRSIMVNDSRSFRLLTAGDHTVIRDSSGDGDSLIRGHKLTGSVMVNLVWDESVSPDARKGDFLKSAVAARAQVIEVPSLYSSDQDSEISAKASSTEQHTMADVVPKTNGTVAKVPKWLKLGKK